MEHNYIFGLTNGATGVIAYYLIRLTLVSFWGTSPHYPLVGFYATESELSIPSGNWDSSWSLERVLAYEDRDSLRLVQFMECCEQCPKYASTRVKDCESCFIESCIPLEGAYLTGRHGGGFRYPPFLVALS